MSIDPRDLLLRLQEFGYKVAVDYDTHECAIVASVSKPLSLKIPAVKAVINEVKQKHNKAAILRLLVCGGCNRVCDLEDTEVLRTNEELCSRKKCPYKKEHRDN